MKNDGRQRTSVRRAVLGLSAAVALVLATAFAAGCTGGDDVVSTTSSCPRIPPNMQIVRLTEASNGTTVNLSPGFLLIVDLEGEPSLRYHWDVLPPDPLIVRMLPGPVIRQDTPGIRGDYTFTGIALNLGETALTADYVNLRGQVDRSFQVMLRVVEAVPTTTTSEGSTETTEASTTTTTAAPTTTTSATTTTTAPSTTTTQRPTTTTESLPTTTSVTLPPTTSTSYIERPPIEEVPGNTYLDERNLGEIVYAMVGGKIVLTLGGNPSTGYVWELVRYEESVISLDGDPQFIPESDAVGAPGVFVWTFSVLKADAQTPLALVYRGPDGNVEQYFYVGIVTTTAEATPY
jgi:predicted secreted protein